MKRILFFLSTFLVIAYLGGRYWPVTVQIHGSTTDDSFSLRMPLKDKKRLEYFFRDVCFLNAWAYTLMGSKPMSIHQYRKPRATIQYFIDNPELKDILLECFWPPNFRNICFFFNPEQLKIKLGWEALNKYIHYFPNSRFVLYTSDAFNNEIIGLRLIDKKKMAQVVKKNMEDFRQILHAQAIEADDLFDNIKLRRFLKALDHDGYLGTLLGFGRDNAWLYHKYRGMDLAKSPMVSPWPEEEVVNLEKLSQKDITFQPWDLSDLFYPRFACDPDSEETKQLKQTYRQEREAIVKYYEGKDVVEATLSLFNQK